MKIRLKMIVFSQKINQPIIYITVIFRARIINSVLHFKYVDSNFLKTHFDTKKRRKEVVI